MDTLVIRKSSQRHMPTVSLCHGDGYTRENGEATVYAVVYINRRKIRFNTGVTVPPEFYDQATGKVIRAHPMSSDYNLMINSTRARLSDIFVKYRLQYKDITPSLLRKEFKSYSKHIDFHSFLQHAIKERRGEITASSIKQHDVLASKLMEYSPDLTFAQIDEDFLVKFNRWLINKKKNSPNTRHNAFKNLKTYLNIARRKQLITHNPLEAYSPVKRVTPEREFLSEEELRKLQKLYARNYLNKTDHRILRHFLFMCFTGLRISDLKAVQMEDIHKDLLIFTAYKTRERKPAATKIPLCRFALQLIKDESPHRLHGPVFKTFTEQTMRKRIKEIVKVEKIQKDLSLHTGRHTFATLFLKKTRNIAALQKLLGHTKIEMTMVYAHILTEDIEQEIQRAFSDF
jgi:integrase/recombinase XerD